MRPQKFADLSEKEKVVKGLQLGSPYWLCTKHKIAKLAFKTHSLLLILTIPILC
jgi:hypothetical protein